VIRRKSVHAIAVAFAAAAFAIGFTTPAAARALVRTPADAAEVDSLRGRHPKAIELMEQGEALAVDGSLARAHALFEQAESEDTNASIVWRRDCEVLTLLGRREDALHACAMASQGASTPVNLRATIRALVTGPAPPKTINLFIALTLLQSRMRGSGRVDPVLADSACDIAESVGDTRMLQECADNLQKIAPERPSTKRALALLAARCPPWRFWLGWGAVIAAVAATLIRAAGGLARRRRAVAVMAASFFVSAGLPVHESVAWAQGPPPTTRAAPKAALSDWPVDDDNPAGSIPSESRRNSDPLQFGYWIQDLIMKAEHAAKRGNHEQAAKYWEALGIAVPDRSIAFSRLCDEYEADSDYDRAIEACGQALLREGLTVQDYAHFVHVVLAKPGPVEPKEAAALGQVLEHIRTEDAAHDVLHDLECQVGMRTANVPLLKECTAALVATSPDDPKTLSYRWALAMQENRFRDATKLIEAAKAKGAKPEGIASMERTTAEGKRLYWRRVSLWTACLTLLLGAMGVGARVLGARRRATTQPA
jgi:tetratricopeptide (TPR) repeat protein